MPHGFLDLACSGAYMLHPTPAPPGVPDAVRHGAGYVEQFDTMLPELSVRDTLLYTAELKCAPVASGF